MRTIASHSGSFHADDVVGCTVLRAIIRKTDAENIIRTRDPERIAMADFAVDVGGAWDASRGRFDHHQKGFDGRRDSGVLYASAGLVWAAHGVEFVMNTPSLTPVTEAEAAIIAKAIDDELMQYLDMADTGEANMAPAFFGLSALLSTFNRTSLQERELRSEAAGQTVETMQYVAFIKACDCMAILLDNVVAFKLDELRSAELVRAGSLAEDGKVLVLSASGLSWYNVVCNEMPDVQFVIYPDSTDQQYQVRTVPVTPDSFKARMDLPRAWAGLRDTALAEVSGVEDAVFCHNSVFIGGAKSLAGALLMAHLALKSQETTSA